MQNKSSTRSGSRPTVMIILAVVAAVLWSGAALAVPAAVPYIGYLSDDSGPYDGTVAIIVEMFDEADGGASLWGPVEFADVVVESGVFTVVLGAPSGPELDTLVLPADGAWLEFTIDGTLLEPRQEMLSVPYALWAESADACGEAESLGDSGCGDGQVIKWVAGGGVWICADDLVGGGAEYTAGTGLNLVGTEFSVVVATIEGWATGVCYDTPTELTGALSGWDQDASDDLTPGDLALVASSGSYDDLADQPDLSVYLKADGSVDLVGDLDVTGDQSVSGTLTVGDTDVGAKLAVLEGEIWCLKQCDPAKIGDCQDRDCDGISQTCTESGPLPDGAACQGGVGMCISGECCVPATCESLAKECGDWDDGCGGLTGECGPCTNGHSCEDDGQCDGPCALLDGQTCGGICCPELPGYTVTCNAKDHCEYANDDAGGWKAWDVWIYIAPGSFQMGSEGEGGPVDETPVHGVIIGYGYFISKHENVVSQYEGCMADAGTCSAPSTVDWDGSGWGTNSTSNHGSDHPQNGLTWQQAKVFCAWVTPGGRLPSESEWEYAATGPVHLKYPWGNSPDPTCSNNTAVFNEDGGTGGYGCSQGGTWSVGSKSAGASWCGALDMSGNLWEWCEDWWHGDYNSAPDDGSAWVVPTGSYRVIRGGGFNDGVVTMRSAKRNYSALSYRDAGMGARCLRPLP